MIPAIMAAMDSSKKPPGRPPFRIDPQRLRGMRVEKGLTQEQLATLAYAAAGKPSTHAVSHYQKIERHGRTSIALATALSTVLGTTLPLLQGAPPDDAPEGLDALERQLHRQLKAGRNEALKQALRQALADGQSVRGFALELMQQIEVAQIGQQQADLKHLCGLTGWRAERLMQLGGALGHWLMLSRGPFEMHSDMRLGWSGALAMVREAGERFPDAGSDSVLTLRRESPWLHLERADGRLHQRISVVPFRPEPTGLRWTAPGWRDTFWIENGVLEWAWRTTNILVDLNGVRHPRDLDSLALALQEFDADGVALAETAIDADRSDVPDNIRQDWQASGHEHDFTTGLLVSAAWQVLAPHLRAVPWSCWRVAAGPQGIAIELDLPRHLAPVGTARHPGLKYRLALAERQVDGRREPAPWRLQSIERAVEHLRRLFERERGESTPGGPTGWAPRR